MARIVVAKADGEFKSNDRGSTRDIFSLENIGTTNLDVHITEYSPGKGHKMDIHPEHDEVIFVLDGQGITTTGTDDKPISPGTFVFIPANTNHSTMNSLKDKPLKTIIIKVKSKP